VKAIRPRSRTSPRPLRQTEREVEALLIVGHGYRPREAERVVAKWSAYVKSRWAMQKAPCQIADHLAKFEREKVVEPRRKR